MFIIGIKDGKFELHRQGYEGRVFELHDKEGLKEHFQRLGITNIMSSSSMNWPEDCGVSEDVMTVGEIADIVKYALSWQGEVPVDFRDLPGYTTKDKTEGLIHTLEGGINIMGNDFAEVLKEKIPHMHRTLQQGLMRDIVKPIIEVFAELWENGEIDPRNEATCEAASKLKEVMDSYGFPCI